MQLISGISVLFIIIQVVKVRCPACRVVLQAGPMIPCFSPCCKPKTTRCSLVGNARFAPPVCYTFVTLLFLALERKPVL